MTPRFESILVPLGLAMFVVGIVVPTPIALAGAPVRVTAVDPDGHPVVGALVVEARPDLDGRFVIDVTAPVLGVCDDRGVLTPLPTLRHSDSRWAVFATNRAAVLVPDTSEAVTVRLDPATVVVGRLMDEQGRPATDATLRATPGPSEGLDSLPHDRVAYRVVPDATGTFSLTVALASPLDWVVVRRDGRHEPVADFHSGGVVIVARGCVLSGRVIDLEGAQSPDRLEVTLRPVTAERRRDDVADLAAIRAVTDPAGRIRFFDVPAGVYEAELSDSRYAFDGDPPRVDASGFAPRRIETWWIERRATVMGRVVEGKTRTPIAGATVIVAPPADATPSRTLRAPTVPVTTALDGTFRVEGILPGAGYRLAVTAKDRASVVETVDLQRGTVTDRGQILLLSSRTVRVTIVDDESRPVPGAEVWVTPIDRPEPDASDPVSAFFVRSAVAQSDGVAVVTDVTEGGLLVRARCEGYIDGRATTSDPGPGLVRNERIEMAHRAAIRGVVRFADRPVDGIRVRGRGRSSGDLREAAIERDGTFVLKDFGSEPVDVELTSARGSTGGVRSIVLARREAVIAGSSEVVILDVPVLRLIAGDVDGLSGDRGPPRARLEVQRFDPVFDDVRWSVVEEQPLEASGGHARFEFTSIPPGRFAVRAIEGSGNTGPVDVLVEAGDVDGLSLRMPAPARIAGRVVDGVKFSAALGARVRMIRLEGDSSAPEPSGSSPTTVTRDDGEFAFDDVAPGRFRVEAGDDGVASSLVEVTLREGEHTFLSLRLESGGWIEGTVTDASAHPLATVPVRVVRLPAEDPVDRTRTGESGKFRTRPLPAGNYRLALDAGRGLAAGLEADVEVVAGQRTVVDLSSHGDGIIEGVVRRRGTPVPGLRVEAVLEGARGADRLVLRTNADAFGQYRFPGLAEGAYRLAIIDGAVRGTSAVRLRSGDRIAQDLEVGEGRISGTVRTSKGDAVREADVIAIPDSSGAVDLEGRVRTAPDGTFSISGLPVGRYRLVVTPAGRPSRVVGGVFADLAGQERPVEIVIGRGARLELIVKDDRRRPVCCADVWIEDAKGVTLHPRALRTGPFGRLVVDGLPEGRCQLRVRASGYGRAGPVPVDLRDGSVCAAEVIVKPAGSILLVVKAGFDPRGRARVDLYRMPGRIAVEARRTLRRPDEIGCFGVTARTGVLLLDDLEEGNYLIVINAGRELEELRIAVYVRAGEVEPVAALLRPPPR